MGFAFTLFSHSPHSLFLEVSFTLNPQSYSLYVEKKVFLSHFSLVIISVGFCKIRNQKMF